MVGAARAVVQGQGAMDVAIRGWQSLAEWPCCCGCLQEFGTPMDFVPAEAEDEEAEPVRQGGLCGGLWASVGFRGRAGLVCCHNAGQPAAHADPAGSKHRILFRGSTGFFFLIPMVQPRSWPPRPPSAGASARPPTWRPPLPSPLLRHVCVRLGYGAAGVMLLLALGPHPAAAAALLAYGARSAHSVGNCFCA